jgi:hypothetical protein
MPSNTPYAPQIKIVELLERTRQQTVELRIYRDGALVAPTAFTYSLNKPNGDALIDQQAGTIIASIATYTISAGTLSSDVDLGEGYVEEWRCTIDSEVYTFRRMAAVVRRRLYPVVSDADITSTYSQLESLRPSGMSSYQQYIDEAWYQILQRIRREGGGLEYLIMSPEVFRAAHQNLSLYYIFRDFHSSLGQSNGRYLDLATEHHEQYQYEYKQINFIYDNGHDGVADNPDQRIAKQPVIYTCKSGRFARGFRP